MIALALLLVGYWAAFALYPLPSADFDYPRVGVPKDWPLVTGFAAHWNKNSNLAWAFDTWFLNLFPRQRPFVFNEGGYSTLSFIPMLGTMILGLIAGGVLRSDRTGLGKGALAGRCGHHWSRGWADAWSAWHLPGGEVHLDSQLDTLQRGMVLSTACELLCAN